MLSCPAENITASYPVDAAADLIIFSSADTAFSLLVPKQRYVTDPPTAASALS